MLSFEIFGTWHNTTSGEDLGFSDQAGITYARYTHEYYSLMVQNRYLKLVSHSLETVTLLQIVNDSTIEITVG